MIYVPDCKLMSLIPILVTMVIVYYLSPAQGLTHDDIIVAKGNRTPLTHHYHQRLGLLFAAIYLRIL